jgi:hypothetical protein
METQTVWFFNRKAIFQCTAIDADIMRSTEIANAARLCGRRVLSPSLVCGMAMFLGVSITLAAAPAWWAEFGLTDTNAPADNAVLNMGQLHYMTHHAALAMDSRVPGGHGYSVSNVLSLFSGEIRHSPVALGQLKSVGALVYDRLRRHALTNDLPAGMAGAYPWTDSTEDDSDASPCNIGQAKYVFSYGLPSGEDADSDGLLDWWEVYHFGGTHLVTSTSNPDSDGLDCGQEFTNQTVPDDFDTDNDGLSDGLEVSRRTDPCNPDTNLPTVTVTTPISEYINIFVP